MCVIARRQLTGHCLPYRAKETAKLITLLFASAPIRHNWKDPTLIVIHLMQEFLESEFMACCARRATEKRKYKTTTYLISITVRLTVGIKMLNEHFMHFRSARNRLPGISMGPCICSFEFDYVSRHLEVNECYLYFCKAEITMQNKIIYKHLFKARLFKLNYVYPSK